MTLIIAARINFNPRSCQGATGVEDCTVWWDMISIHTPAGGATTLQHLVTQSYRFQSALPRGERPATAGTIRTVKTFQPTLPRGERLRTPHSRNSIRKFQPALPRGSDRGSDLQADGKRISIHSPMRGTTCMSGTPHAPRVISTRAPARGATGTA